MKSLINAWQNLPSQISPDLLTIGSFHLRYYSLMYIVAFAFVYFLVLYRIRTEKYEYTAETIQDFLVWAMIGLILGGRLGYVFFYNWGFYSKHLLEIFLPFDFSHGMKFVGISGMSYHGGLIGIVAVSTYFCIKRKINFWRFADLICPTIPLGYTFGRIGNFINGELWGRVTTVPWGMNFPLAPTPGLRHPSQLYEALFEGVFLFILLWAMRKKKHFEGFLLGMYIIGYGSVRFIIEFFREPDYQLGFVLGFLSMGQVLCLAMILGGIVIILWRKRSSA
jgi:phosphatidylglycerol---prolipoprotein diacylglyceryl transferase